MVRPKPNSAAVVDADDGNPVEEEEGKMKSSSSSNGKRKKYVRPKEPGEPTKERRKPSFDPHRRNNSIHGSSRPSKMSKKQQNGLGARKEEARSQMNYVNMLLTFRCV